MSELPAEVQTRSKYQGQTANAQAGAAISTPSSATASCDPSVLLSKLGISQGKVLEGEDGVSVTLEVSLNEVPDLNGDGEPDLILEDETPFTSGLYSPKGLIIYTRSPAPDCFTEVYRDEHGRAGEVVSAASESHWATIQVTFPATFSNSGPGYVRVQANHEEGRYRLARAGDCSARHEDADLTEGECQEAADYIICNGNGTAAPAACERTRVRQSLVPASEVNAAGCSTLDECVAECQNTNASAACSEVLSYAEEAMNDSDDPRASAGGVAVLTRLCDAKLGSLTAEDRAGACRMVGYAHGKGVGTSQDIRRSSQFYDKACKIGGDTLDCASANAASCVIKTKRSKRRMSALDPYCNPDGGRPGRGPFKAYSPADPNLRIEADDCFDAMRSIDCHGTNVASKEKSAYCCR